jgi:hypothetical protein
VRRGGQERRRQNKREERGQGKAREREGGGRREKDEPCIDSKRLDQHLGEDDFASKSSQPKEVNLS